MRQKDQGFPIPGGVLSAFDGIRHVSPRDAILAALRIAAVVAAYVALEWVSYLHEHKGIPVTPWNPGLGLVFGLMVLKGARYAVLLALGVFLAEALVLKVDLSPLLIAAVSVLIGIGYGCAAVILRRVLRIDTGLSRLRDIAQLLGVGLAGALFVGILLAALLLVDDEFGRNDLVVTFLPMFVGDAIGIAVFSPLVLRLAARLRASSPAFALLPAVELGALALFVLLLIAGLNAVPDAAGLRFTFVLFVPVVYAAARHGLDGACICLAATQFGLIMALNAAGQDARVFTEFQTQMLVLTLTGLIVGVVVSEREALTQRARETAARLRELELEAQQAARFSLAGGMASALAHEINQPITAARALARSAQHLIRSDRPDLARAERNLGDMIGQVDHAGNIVRRMRDFLRRGRPHVSTIPIDAMVRNAASLVAAEAGAAGVALSVAVEDGLPPLYGDRTQLEQVLLNLVRNGLEAIRDSQMPEGRILIRVQRGAVPEEVEFHVADNGPGIPDDRRARLFEPLISSKPEGLGLGLAISASIVQNHHGRIWLASGERGRTEFRLALPYDTSREAGHG